MANRRPFNQNDLKLYESDDTYNYDTDPLMTFEAIGKLEVEVTVSTLRQAYIGKVSEAALHTILQTYE